MPLQTPYMNYLVQPVSTQRTDQIRSQIVHSHVLKPCRTASRPLRTDMDSDKDVCMDRSMWNKTATSLWVTTVSRFALHAALHTYTHAHPYIRSHTRMQVDQRPAPWILRMGDRPFKETLQPCWAVLSARRRSAGIRPDMLEICSDRNGVITAAEHEEKKKKLFLKIVTVMGWSCVILTWSLILSYSTNKCFSDLFYFIYIYFFI